VCTAMAALALLACSPNCSRAPVERTATGVPLRGPLIPAATTMVTAWELPKNPLTDKQLDASPLANEIRWGFKIFTSAPAEGQWFATRKMSYNNCLLKGGQREKSPPLVGSTGFFREYTRRSGRLFSLGDRIVDCFLRSENATGASQTPEELPSHTSREVLAVSAYLTWLSRGSEVGHHPWWAGQNTLQRPNPVSIDKLDRAKGESLFMERCPSCHGADGQGVAVGDKKPGPLWGDDSWNDGAGAARVYTLAGIIRYAMPYLDPGNLTDQEAQHVAAFINSKPRPAYPFKDRDHRTEKLPVDSVYYSRR